MANSKKALVIGVGAERILVDQVLVVVDGALVLLAVIEVLALAVVVLTGREFSRVGAPRPQQRDQEKRQKPPMLHITF